MATGATNGQTAFADEAAPSRVGSVSFTRTPAAQGGCFCCSAVALQCLCQDPVVCSANNTSCALPMFLLLTPSTRCQQGLQTPSLLGSCTPMTGFSERWMCWWAAAASWSLWGLMFTATRLPRWVLVCRALYGHLCTHLYCSVVPIAHFHHSQRLPNCVCCTLNLYQHVSNLCALHRSGSSSWSLREHWSGWRLCGASPAPTPRQTCPPPLPPPLPMPQCRALTWRSGGHCRRWWSIDARLVGVCLDDHYISMQIRATYIINNPLGPSSTMTRSQATDL